MPLVMMVVLVKEVHLTRSSEMRGSLDASGHDGSIGQGSTYQVI